MNNHDKMLPPYPYGRTEFLSDVAWMGLDLEQAFSRPSLRRQRDRLMQLHHPDRGGSEEIAARINVTYSRMIAWLDRRLETRNYLRMRREKAFAKQAAGSATKPPDPAKFKIETIRLYAAILGTATAAIGIGLGTLVRRRR